MTLQQAGLVIIVLVWVVTFFDGVVGENATSRWAFWLHRRLALPVGF
jgi:hypothetical protein